MVAQLASAQVCGACVQLHFTDGSTVGFALIYLRDSCLCSLCFHPTTLQRKVDVRAADLTAKASVQCDAVRGSVLHVEWGDGHVSEYTSEWVCSRAHVRASHGRLSGVQPTSWTAAWMKENMERECTFDFQRVISRPKVTLRWLQALRRFGLTRLVGAQRASGQVQYLSSSLHVPLRRTVYDENGSETFNVQVKPNAVNQAYTAEELPLHIDMPYYRSPPSVQLLHCIQQDGAVGGASTFADGLYAADTLREEHAEMFELLATTDVVFEDVDPSTPPRYHLEAIHPVLELDSATRSCVAVNFNNHTRSSLLAMDPADTEKIRAHYKASNMLATTLEKEIFERRASPGDMWVFDNRRVLHGRRAIEQCAARHLEGGYFEWDDLDGLHRRAFARASDSE